MKTVFDSLYDASAEVVRGLKKPLIKKAVMRALEGASDSLEGIRIETEMRISDLTRALANGKVEVVQDLIRNRLLLAEVMTQQGEALAIAAELSAPAPAEEK